mmetsp:Transcript_6267/g.15804  ORF Transcript_6267/g.15804 Transcript_6267/m.15804 type:complete len:1341 (-) Transcript_6267:79-4101(-)
MATVQQILNSTLGGSIVTVASWTFFGLAVRFGGNSNLTPRAWSRPREVIKNAISPPYAFGWITWAVRLKYIDMLVGIPGTGTRKKGWSGPPLKANLDAVIAMRFQSLQLKISILTTVLCMFMLLPLFITTTCDPIELGVSSCINQQNLTNFEMTTIANVPALTFNGVNDTEIQINETTSITLEGRDPDTQVGWAMGLTGRYMAVVVVMGLMSYYTCYLLWYEWVECLALRRVYYLESDYYLERLSELDGLRGNKDPEDDFQRIRPPFLPHPEMRETIPNVSLNSVLYQLPQHLKVLPSTVDGASSLTERQLAATVDFFDQCVPNQPGFTSSVVAATIIPDADLVSRGWMKWYGLGKKMRRYRFIKQVIAERKEMQADGIKGLYDYVGDVSQTPVLVARATARATTQLEATLRKSRNKNTGGASHKEGIADDDAAGDDNKQTNKQTDAEATPGDDLSDIEMGSMIERSSALDDQQNPPSHPVAAHFSPNAEEEISFEPEKRVDNAEGGGLFSYFFGPHRASSGLTRENRSSSTAGNRAESPTHNSNRISVGSEGEFVNHPTNADKSDSMKGTFQSTRRSASTGGSEVLESVAEQADPATKSKDNRLSIATAASNGSALRFDYEDFNATEYAKWIGYSEETELDQLVDELGIEQLCLYAREMSQSASNCCVYGCGINSLKLASIAELEDMATEALEAVREANAELLQTRADIFREEGQIDADHVRDLTLEEKANKLDEDPPVSSMVSPILEETNFDIDEEDDGNEEEIEDGSALDLRDDNGLGEEGVPLTATMNTNVTGLRKRVSATSIREKYKMAQSLIRQMNTENVDEDKKERRSCCDRRPKLAKKARRTAVRLSRVLDHPSYAVVTFSSRQAAIAARQCLADGRGINRWSQVDDIPTAPLADAPPLKPFFCRSCCRPVTLTLNYKQKKLRRLFIWTFYFFFCCLYTVPLALTSSLLNPAYLQSLYPDSALLEDGSFFYRVLAGFSSGALYSLFFSILPQVFKLLAFTEGVASSIPVAEDHALLFYWYFMLLTAFTGSTLATMLLEALTTGELQTTLKDALVQVARTIPTSQAPVWLNWIVVRTLYTLPMNYLCQAMTWLYDILPCKWLNRVMRGGGPGGPPPIRIPIDSCVVFMCMTSLAPVAPLIAPFATLQYLVFIPILRWLNVFVYRPKYDGGGNKWPVYHQFVISALIWGQLLTGTQLFLKQAIIPGALVVALTLPTFFFSQWTQEIFLVSYRDAGLLQTSQLDGWEHTETISDREKYRNWLVDCHKASYVPICLSGGDDFLTVQPALVVPTSRDEEATLSPDSVSRRGLNKEDWQEITGKGKQKGAIWKRYLDD